MKKIYTILRNLVQSIKNTLQKSKDYTDGQITSAFNNYIRCDWFTSASVTCGANAAGQVMVSYTVPTGYTTLIYLNTASHGNVVPSYVSGFESGNRVSIWWINNTSYKVTCTFSVRILFIKNVGGVVLNYITHSLKGGCVA